MSKAEYIHYKAVVAADNQEPPKDYCTSANADHFNGFVEGFVEGYHQAEKDLELTWEDIMTIDDLLDELLPPRRDSDELVLKGYYEEVLKRFNNFKHVK